MFERENRKGKSETSFCMYACIYIPDYYVFLYRRAAAALRDADRRGQVPPRFVRANDTGSSVGQYDLFN